MLKKIAAVIALTGIVIGVAACNTVEGVGMDVKATGGAVEKAAEKSKPY
jgi:predicted small secreted protein